jgi:hypothetical protein
METTPRLEAVTSINAGMPASTISAVIDAWDESPEAIREGSVAMVRAAMKADRVGHERTMLEAERTLAGSLSHSNKPTRGTTNYEGDGGSHALMKCSLSLRELGSAPQRNR